MLPLIYFWSCTLLFFYSYVLYLPLLKIFSLGKKGNQNVFTSGELLPNVYILIAAHNEAQVIEEKVESIFSSDYPTDLIKVYIGDDNSSDRTPEILDLISKKFPQVRIQKFDIRTGKPKLLNQLVESIDKRGLDPYRDILMLTDANVLFTSATIFETVKHFKNSDIGLVGANILNKEFSADGISFQEKSYIRIENTTKYLEGLNWGCMMGAFGGCFAMRFDLWQAIPENFIVDDFFLTMSVLANGEKAILEKQAICYEDVSNEVENEFRRKSRIQAGNFQNLSRFWKILFKPNATAFCFLSHKVLRWVGPLLILGAYLSNIFLLSDGYFYVATFIGLNFFLLSPLFDSLLKRLGLHLILLRFASYFMLMNVALIYGFFAFARGIKTNVWEPTKRNIA